MGVVDFFFLLYMYSLFALIYIQTYIMAEEERGRVMGEEVRGRGVWEGKGWERKRERKKKGRGGKLPVFLTCFINHSCLFFFKECIM